MQCLEKIRTFVKLFRVVTDYYLGILDNNQALQYLFGIETYVCHPILLRNTSNALSNTLLCTLHSLGSWVMTRRAGKDWFKKMAFQCSLLHLVHILIQRSSSGMVQLFKVIVLMSVVLVLALVGIMHQVSWSPGKPFLHSHLQIGKKKQV